MKSFFLFSGSNSPWRRWLLCLLAGLGMAFYLAQYATLAPNNADEALILDYIHLMAHGGKPFWDFVDLYGPLNWIFPTLAYVGTGEKVWGIRLWLIVLKMLIVFLTYWTARRLVPPLYAGLAAILMMVVLGQPWQYFQTPYSFLHMLPALLIAWGMLLSPPEDPKNTGRLILAGIATAWVIWTKLNTGMLLWVGGLFHCFFLRPVLPARVWVTLSPKVRLFKALIVLAIYGAVFTLWIWPYFNPMYFWYLWLPMVLVLALAGWQAVKEARTAQGESLFWGRTQAALIYGTSSSLVTLLFFWGYYGFQGGRDYLHETLGLLHYLDYMKAFSPLGLPGLYGAFNTHYWLQLPWLVLLLMGIGFLGRVFWPLSPRESTSPAAGRTLQIQGIFALATFNAYVMYSRSDETHVTQAIVPNLLVLAVVLYWVQQAWIAPLRARLWSYRLVTLGALALWVSTIATLPTLQRLIWKPQEWHSPRLEYLQFPDPARRLLYETEAALNQASAYLAQRVPPGTEVLVLPPGQILNYNSHTIPVGGRHRYLFYLLRMDLMKRADFDAVAPPGLLENLLRHPPPMAVSERGKVSLLKEIPEFQTLLDREYRLVRTFGRFLIYEHQSLPPPS